MADDKRIDADEVESYDLLAFAKAYVGLGWAVQEQLEQLMDGGGGSVNPNVVTLMRERLWGFHAEIDDAIVEFEEARQ